MFDFDAAQKREGGVRPFSLGEGRIYPRSGLRQITDADILAGLFGDFPGFLSAKTAGTASLYDALRQSWKEAKE